MFPGGGMGNMQAMMKKVQKMQNDMLKAQEELKKRTVEAVVVSGRKELVSIKINPDAVDLEDIEMLEDMIVSAVNDGIRQADEMSEKEMAKITGGMKLPGM